MEDLEEAPTLTLPTQKKMHSQTAAGTLAGAQLTANKALVLLYGFYKTDSL